MSLDSKQEIMEATYKALSRHGYADLTIEKIAVESEKGKSLIYYHFDDKEDLMVSFLDYMNNRLEEDLKELEQLEPEKQLNELLDLLLCEDQEMWNFRKALFELEVQAQHNPDFKEKFQEIYKMLIDITAETLEEIGVEEPEINAKLMISTIEGTVNQQIILEEQSMKERKEKLKEIINCGKN